MLVHNFTLDVEERLGIDEPTVRAARPTSCTCTSTPTGGTGRGRVTAGSPSWRTSRRASPNGRWATSGRPRPPPPRWTTRGGRSPTTRRACSGRSARLSRCPTARARAAGTSSRRPSRATALEQVLYIVADGAEPVAEPRGTATPGWGALQRLYTTGDGGTVFVGASPGRWGTLAAALTVDIADAGEDGLGRGPRTGDRRPADGRGAALRAVGVGAHPVVSVRELMAPGGVADRRGLRLEDQTEEFGAVVMPGPVVRFGCTPMRPGAIPGAFGSDREAILERLGGGGASTGGEA